MTYERRYAGVGLERRGQRGPNDASGVSYTSVLGANLVAMWHSQLGIALVSGNVDTWTDQIGGRVLQAPGAAQRPVYAADSTFFGGKSVVQTAVTGSKCLFGASLTSLAPVNTFPWVFARLRSRAQISNQVYAGGDSASQGRGMAVRNLFGNFGSSDLTAINAGTGVVADAIVRNLEGWGDGTNVNAAVDGVAGISAQPSGLQFAMTNFAVGASPQSLAAAGFSDVSAALVLVCSSYPGATLAATVRAMAAAEFPP